MSSYAPLETERTIRLLHFSHNGLTSSRSLEFRIEHVTINNAPKYETLSYVWGTNKRDHTLGLHDGQEVHITGTLEKAIPEILNRCTTSYLWIDQICIDQESIYERNHQVALMGEIYSRCSRVIVWLGFQETFQPEFISMCRKASHVLLHANLSGADYGMSTMFKELVSILPKGSEDFSKFRQQLYKLLECAWFKRAWVFQEIILPKVSNFILLPVAIAGSQANGHGPNAPAANSEDHQRLGDAKTSIPLIAVYWLYHASDFPPLGIEKGNSMNNSVVTRPEDHIIFRMYDRWAEIHLDPTNSFIKRPIEEFLCKISSVVKTSEEVDKIYAFYGLHNDMKIQLRADYHLTIEEALTATTRSIIEGTQSLEILTRVSREGSSTPPNFQLPSWVPNFLQPKLAPRLARVQYYKSSRSYNGSCDGLELRTRGVIVDNIHSMVSDWGQINDVVSEFPCLVDAAVAAWEKTARRHPTPTPQAVFIALNGGSVSKSDHDNGESLYQGTENLSDGMSPAKELAGPMDDDIAVIKALESKFDALREYERMVAGADWPWFAGAQSGPAMSQRETMSYTIHGRGLWVTDAGRLVLGSQIEVGDLVCVLEGCITPVALRRVKDDKYTLAGTVYVDNWDEICDNTSENKVEFCLI